MNTRRIPLSLLLLASMSAAQAQLVPPPKPGDETPQAPARAARPAAGLPLQDMRPGPVVAPRAGVARPLPGAVNGPGTQTEDDVYVGRRVQGALPAGAARTRQGQWCEEDCRKAPGGAVPAPGAQPPLARPVLPLALPGGATAAPRLGNKTRATGDEDEMEDLDIQRRKVQGLPETKGDAPRKEQPGGEQPRGERR